MILSIIREKIGKEFVATPIRLLHTCGQLLLTKFLGLVLTDSERTCGFEPRISKSINRFNKILPDVHIQKKTGQK